MEDRVQSRGGACPKWKAAYVEERLKSGVEAMNDTQRISVYKSIMDEVAKVDESVAAKLNACYAVSESPSKACDAFLKDVCTLVTLHDPGRVRTFLQDEAETRPDWARTFGGSATVVAKSIAKLVSSSVMRFLPRDAVRCPSVHLSVCLSVCLSVTFVHSIQTSEDIV